MAPQSIRNLDVDSGNGSVEAVRNCSSLAELHSVIPLSFRPALGELITKIYRIAQKAGTVGNTIAQYDKHSMDETIPPFINNTIKRPKIQFSNEYDSTLEGKGSDSAFDKIVKDARKLYLDEALKRKKQEQTTLLAKLVFNEGTWQNEVVTTAQRVFATMGGFCRGTYEESPYVRGLLDFLWVAHPRVNQSGSDRSLEEWQRLSCESNCHCQIHR